MEPLEPKGEEIAGQDPILSLGWMGILTEIAKLGYDYWQSHINSGDDIGNMIYNIYNLKPTCFCDDDYSSKISNVPCNAGIMPVRQGIFKVFFNIGNIGAFNVNFDREWRVYVNAYPHDAPARLAHILKLFDDPECRIVQAKIVTDGAEASKRSDIIVIYTDSEASARRVAHRVNRDYHGSNRLGREAVYMASRCTNGIAIGESPVGRPGDEDEAISFGDLRASVLGLVVKHACQRQRPGGVGFPLFLKALSIWLPFFVRVFGLSEQDSSRNGNAAKQPKSKSELKARVLYWEQKLAEGAGEPRK